MPWSAISTQPPFFCLGGDILETRDGSLRHHLGAVGLVAGALRGQVPWRRKKHRTIEPRSEDLKTVIVDGRYIMIYTTWDIESTIICNIYIYIRYVYIYIRIYIYTYVCVDGLGGLVKNKRTG